MILCIEIVTNSIEKVINHWKNYDLIVLLIQIYYIRRLKMKIIAFYLPQFHEIPENDEWWGEGFTEWVNVKAAKPLYNGHSQPKTPLNNNYYNLLQDETKIWQAKIAKEHGIYGFCYYHYWFSGKKLLEKPMEQMLKNQNIDIPFCISWANEPWTKAWIGKNEVLLPQAYGDKNEWTNHYNYLRQFFKDKRYITVDEKPLMVIYRVEVIPCLNEMLDYWNELAKEDGFLGLSYAYQSLTWDKIGKKDDSRFDFDIEFQPSYAWWDISSKSLMRGSAFWRFLRKIKRKIYIKLEKKLGFDMDKYVSNGKKKSTLLKDSYDEIWKTIIEKKPENKKAVPGAFVRWDNTPRKGNNGRVSIGDTPEKFQNYLKKQIIHAREDYDSDMIFMFAWNEWAEGGFLEPDVENNYSYLQAVKNALEETNEFPNNKN